MNQSEREHLKCRLFLHAVLPAMEDLFRYSKEAQEIVGERPFSIAFKSRSGLSSALFIENGECRWEKDPQELSSHALTFLSDNQINALFSGEGFSLPIPTRGLLQPAGFKRFSQLSELLQTYLEPTREALQDKAFFEAHVRLLLGVALYGVRELGEYEEDSRRILAHTPNGVAQFVVGDETKAAWVSLRNGKLQAGKGMFAEEPDVTIWFRNAQVALLALQNDLDVMAAVGKGDIQVDGSIRLADGLGFVMERIPLYLPAKTELV